MNRSFVIHKFFICGLCNFLIFFQCNLIEEIIWLDIDFGCSMLNRAIFFSWRDKWISQDVLYVRFSTWNQILWKNLHWWLIITSDYLAKSDSYSSKLHNSTHIFLVSNDYSILYEQKCTHKNIMSLNVFIIFEFFCFLFYSLFQLFAVVHFGKWKRFYSNSSQWAKNFRF